MRIIEAMIACILLIFSVSAATQITRLSVQIETNDLQKVGENVLNVLNDPDLVRNVMESGSEAGAQLNSLISSFLPLGTGYIVSFVSAIDGKVICNASNTNMGPSSGYNSFSDTRTVTISLPAAASEYKSIDVMLVMDRSGSMQGTKIQLAKTAAMTFVDQLNTTRDKAGLASFNEIATLDCHLMNDFAEVKNKINSMSAGGFTNMGGGIDESNVEFNTAGRSSSEIIWAMILLSDGKANRPLYMNASQYALDQAAIARDLKGKGVRIYTIGLGNPGPREDDIDEDLLKQIAGDPTRYYHAPTADQLETIYLTIARDLLFQVKYDVIVIQLTLLGSE